LKNWQAFGHLFLGDIEENENLKQDMEQVIGRALAWNVLCLGFESQHHKNKNKIKSKA
jgi:hypothetical protein